MADEVGTQEEAPSPESRREAEVARGLEQAVRAEGSGQLIAAVARLTARYERAEAQLVATEGRVAVLEAAVDALGIPMLRGLAEGLQPPATVTISADMPLDERDGFHWVEHPEAGDPYRWTGANGGDFRFVFMVDRSVELKARLALGRRGPGMESKPEWLECIVDGQHTRAMATGKTEALFEVTLPVRSGGSLTQLVYSTATGPAEAEGDKRELGAPFRYLTVGPDGED
jgi:hypothetical protein